MKKAEYLAVLLIVPFLFAAFQPVALSADAESLKGLKAIYVLIEEIPEDLRSKTGLTDDQLRTDVELKLRLAGITVVSEGKSYDVSGTPFLGVYVNGFVKQSGLVCYDVKIALYQGVILQRNRGIKAVAVTWDSATIGTVGEDSSSFIRGAVKDETDKFINAYLSVNARRTDKQP